ALDSGLEIVNQDTEDISLLSLRDCRMGVTSSGQVDQLVMVADTVDGGVAWRARYPYVTNNWFRGGSGRGLEITGDAVSGPVARNRIEKYDVGLYVYGADGLPIEQNTILYCDTGIEVVNAA